MRWLVNGKLDPEPITGLPQPFTLSSTAGFLDIALDPKYSTNGWVYLAYSHTNGDNSDKSARGMTKIIRGKIKGHNWTEQQTLFEVADSLKVSGGDRWGCRFLFDRQGMEQPVTQWTPSIAVCPIEFCTSPLFPKWKNNLFVGALAKPEIGRIHLCLL